MKPLAPWALPLTGTTLIEASAGTGKTYTLTTLYLRLLVEEDLTPAQILVVTYTQAATAELRDRVRGRIREAIAMGRIEEEQDDEERESLRRLGQAARERAASGKGPDPLRRALAEFDEAAIFTIHGFCQRVLERNAFESGVAFDAELVEAPELLDQTLARDLWARSLMNEDPEFVHWLLAGRGKRWQFEPGALQSNILRWLGADEEMPVEPSLASDAPLEDAAALRRTLADALRNWAALWDVHREEVCAWMLHAPDLNRNKYKAGTVETKWLPHLEEIFEDWGPAASSPCEASIELPDFWEKWTPQQLASGVKKGGEPLESPVFVEMQKVLDTSLEIEKRYQERALALRRIFVDQAREEARRRRQEQHLLFFDDLLSELRAALRPPEGERLAALLREQYRFALIDEFQDTDPVQYEIFRRVWHRSAETPEALPARSGLLLIGDPKQAIYSFRNADLFTYLSARSDAGGAIYWLGTNWRSDPGLLTALNRLFERPSNPFGLDEIAFEPVETRPNGGEGLLVAGRPAAGLRVLLGDRNELAAQRAKDLPGDRMAATEKLMPVRDARTELMRAFARDVANLLESGATIDGRPIVPSDIAVLARKKVELERARKELEALGIPCVDRGDADVFESREAWELLCILHAMLRSGDPDRLRAALTTGAMGLDAEEIADLPDDSIGLAEVSERFAEYARLWNQAGFMRAFESWRRREGVTPRLLGHQDGDRRLTNWLHLAELLQRIESERGSSRSGLADWLERAIADPDMRRALGSDASLLRLERDDEAVCLMTLHRSKGLEFEIVYLPTLWEKDESPGPAEESAESQVKRKPPVRCYDSEYGKRILDLGGSQYRHHTNLGKKESESEQRRLLYVGLTRAKRQCVVLWGAIHSSLKTSLATLLHESEKEDKEALEARQEFTEEDWQRIWEGLGEARTDEPTNSSLALETRQIVAIESPSFAPRNPWQAPQGKHQRLEYERPTRMFPAPRVTTSFSGLVQGAHRGIGVALGSVAQGRDRDSGVESPESVESSAPSDLEGNMDGFPRGAQAGTLLHQVLEETCLSCWEEEETRGLARLALAQSGLDPQHEESILHVVREVSRTPLRSEPSVLRLGEIPKQAFLPEMEFTLAAPGEGERGGLRPDELSEALRRASPDSPFERYSARVRELSWRELHGYLRGFIDAVFFDGERYYLLDYKSNHLGSTQSDYLPPNLLAPMIEHDYILQYLIYSIALDRHLERSLAEYDYETHFGGVYYLFLRGLAASHAPGCGVFFDRPDGAVLKSVSQLIGEPSR